MMLKNAFFSNVVIHELNFKAIKDTVRPKTEMVAGTFSVAKKPVNPTRPRKVQPLTSVLLSEHVLHDSYPSIT